jgi:hypothetical protein
VLPKVPKRPNTFIKIKDEDNLYPDSSEEVKKEEFDLNNSDPEEAANENKKKPAVVAPFDTTKMDLFGRTPCEQYELMKKNLLAKYSNVKVWGGYYSWSRVGALSDLQEYIDKTEQLTMLDPELKEMIDEENVKLLVGKVIPLPKTLREEMNVSLDEESFKSYEDTSDTLRGRLERQKKYLSRLVKEFAEFSLSSHIGRDTMRGDGEPKEFCDDDVDYFEGEFPEEFFDTGCEVKSNLSFAFSEKAQSTVKVQSKHLMNEGKVYDDKESFASMLRWLRWIIYQKIKNKKYTSSDF